MRLSRRLPGLTAALRRRVGAVRGAAVPAAAIRKRLARVGSVFEAVDLFVAPSASLAEEYRRLGLPPERLRISDYGFTPLPVAARAAMGERLRIGFVGTIVWHKGVHVLFEAVSMLPPGRFEVKIAANGFDAGMMVKEYRPDLIVLDVMLPDINGKEVCHRVRADPNLEEVRIICISGMVEEDKIAELKLAGADDFVHKPFDVDMLIERMCQQLDMEAAALV